MTAPDAAELLFSYGTLQIIEVQLSTFGRLLEGKLDSLHGYKSTLVPISDLATATALGTTHYRNITHTGNASDVIEGTVFRVTTDELVRADDYEIDADYKRIVVQLASGVSAWVYLRA